MINVQLVVSNKNIKYKLLTPSAGTWYSGEVKPMMESETNQSQITVNYHYCITGKRVKKSLRLWSSWGQILLHPHLCISTLTWCLIYLVGAQNLFMELIYGLIDLWLVKWNGWIMKIFPWHCMSYVCVIYCIKCSLWEKETLYNTKNTIKRLTVVCK